MNQGLIPSRYAKALYKVALEKGVAANIYALLTTLAQSFENEPQLSKTLANPFVKPADKTALLTTAAGATDADTLYADFLQLLVNNSRLMFMREIALAYMEIYRQANNIHRVKVESAAPLDDDTHQRIRQLVDRHVGQGKIEYQFSVNPDLIGGFTVTVGNDRIDASIANQLKQLRLNLISK